MGNIQRRSFLGYHCSKIVSVWEVPSKYLHALCQSHGNRKEWKHNTGCLYNTKVLVWAYFRVGTSNACVRIVPYRYYNTMSVNKPGQKWSRIIFRCKISVLYKAWTTFYHAQCSSWLSTVELCVPKTAISSSNWIFLQRHFCVIFKYEFLQHTVCINYTEVIPTSWWVWEFYGTSAYEFILLCTC